MNDTKMLQTILEGQSTLLGMLESMDINLNAKIDGLDKRMDGLEIKVDQVEGKLINEMSELNNKINKRIDLLGKQLAEVDDDAPTREEFDKLELRVENLEAGVIFE